MSNGKVIAVVGHTGAGKTTFVKKFSSRFKSSDTYCYMRITSDWEDKRIKAFTNFEHFIRVANTKKNKFFFIDEAVTCLPKKLVVKMDNPRHIHNQLADFLVNARKMNNFVFIGLHSVAQIPTEWLIPYLDYLVRFKTNDLMQYQSRRFSSFPEIAKSLIEIPEVEEYKPIILKLR